MELFNPIWFAILKFGGLLLVGWGLRWLLVKQNVVVERAAKSWPATHGTVEHAEAKLIGEGTSSYWVGELAYSYSVDGEYYAGVRHLPARDEDRASALVEGWKNLKLIVHYRPDKPANSFIVMEEQNRPYGSIS